MKYEGNNFIIEYSSDDLEYIEGIIKAIEKMEKTLLDFFGLAKLSKKVLITIINDTKTFNQLVKEDLTRYKDNVPTWVIGYSKRTENFSKINVLSLKNIKEKQEHQYYDREKMIKLIIHELSHTFHFEYNNSAPWVPSSNS